MDKPIIKYLEEQTCATVCCVDADGHPWCFSCFYAVDAKNSLLIFKSSAGSLHTNILSRNPIIAGTILPDKLNKLKIKGLQFNGTIIDKNDTLSGNAAQIYLKRHPVSLAIAGEIYIIRLDQVKFTNNALGFGKKMIWKRET